MYYKITSKYPINENSTPIIKIEKVKEKGKSASIFGEEYDTYVEYTSNLVELKLIVDAIKTSPI